MGTGLKVALLAAAVAVSVVLLVVLRPGGDGSGPEAARAELVVRDSEVSGPRRIELEQGQQFVLVVEADVSDEVHIHGYDILRDVGPGEPARFEFRAETAGRFDVELEQSQQPLTELVVSP